ncbi:MAG: D-erythronate dehydrogenase [Actinomycetota bacterium]
MRVAVVGAAGMIGRKLIAQLLGAGALAGHEIEAVHAFDVVTPTAQRGAVSVTATAIDITTMAGANAVLATDPDVIYHLAAVVSGEAEADFAKGYRVNVDGTRTLLEACRAATEAGASPPRMVFTSSIAVFGGQLPDVIGDDHHLSPQTSYGTQKVIGEQLVQDYTRRGFVDGVSVRLPTICIRPGAPNKAASGFYSSILREPLQGQPAVIPVAADLRHTFASPRAAVSSLVRAATLNSAAIGSTRSLTLPGLSATISEQLAALERVAGADVAALVRREPDPAIEAIVEGWPRALAAERAIALGFEAESSFDEIIAVFQEDELGH